MKFTEALVTPPGLWKNRTAVTTDKPAAIKPGDVVVLSGSAVRGYVTRALLANPAYVVAPGQTVTEARVRVRQVLDVLGDVVGSLIAYKTIDGNGVVGIVTVVPPIQMDPFPATAVSSVERAGNGAPDSAVDQGLAYAGAALSIAGTAAGAYHGYKRNNSVGWGIAWAVLGGMFPIIALPVAFAQGFGVKAKK